MPIECRRSERTSNRIPITLRIGPSGDAVERMATTVDISHYGARIVTNAQMRLGEKVEFFSPRNSVGPVRAQVGWVTVSPVGPPIEAGLEFVD